MHKIQNTSSVPNLNHHTSFMDTFKQVSTSVNSVSANIKERGLNLGSDLKMNYQRMYESNKLIAKDTFKQLSSAVNTISDNLKEGLAPLKEYVSQNVDLQKLSQLMLEGNPNLIAKTVTGALGSGSTAVLGNYAYQNLKTPDIQVGPQIEVDSSLAWKIIPLVLLGTVTYVSVSLLFSKKSNEKKESQRDEEKKQRFRDLPPPPTEQLKEERKEKTGEFRKLPDTPPFDEKDKEKRKSSMKLPERPNLKNQTVEPEKLEDKGREEKKGEGNQRPISAIKLPARPGKEGKVNPSAKDLQIIPFEQEPLIDNWLIDAEEETPSLPPVTEESVAFVINALMAYREQIASNPQEQFRESFTEVEEAYDEPNKENLVQTLTDHICTVRELIGRGEKNLLKNSESPTDEDDELFNFDNFDEAFSDLYKDNDDETEISPFLLRFVNQNTAEPFLEEPDSDSEEQKLIEQ